jgi:hypothetical protein
MKPYLTKKLAAYTFERFQSGKITEAEFDNKMTMFFAFDMQYKLEIAREKGRSGWWDTLICHDWELKDMLKHHIEKGDMRDVANIAMFLYVRDMLVEETK